MLSALQEYEFDCVEKNLDVIAFLKLRNCTFAHMSDGRIIMTSEHMQLTIERLCYQLIEEFDQLENVCLIGIQPRGVLFADRIVKRLKELLEPAAGARITYGKLDITFYRDDFRTREKPLKASVTDMNFLVENKSVVLIDDVLYTGRTVQAALTALQHYGRPKRVELMALVDRRFNRHLPILADFSGIRVDAVDEAYVKVDWGESPQTSTVRIFQTKESAKD